MARTKGTARRSTGGAAPRKTLARGLCRLRGSPACFNLGYGEPHISTSSNRRHSQRHSQDTASSKIIANFNGAKDFPHFVKLPNEVRSMVWEMLAEEPRAVAVNTKTNGGLRSSIPPILQVCSESRAVGLRHYTLAFESKQFLNTSNVLPPRVYFNFERDTLYLRENWNKNVEGAWCCLSQFTSLVNEDDLKRVKRVGLDVNARVCSLKTSGERCHLPCFASWDALEILYLGYEDARLGSDSPIRFSELESKDYEDFMQRYRLNPCWRLLEDVEAVEAVEHLRNEVPSMYHGVGKKPDCFLRKLELVIVTHL